MLLARPILGTLVCSAMLLVSGSIQRGAHAESEYQNLTSQLFDISAFDAQIPQSDQTAEQLIEYCWNLSEGLRGGSTYDIREGIQMTSQCLESSILDQVAVLFDPQVLSRADAQVQLDNLRSGYAGFYGTLYNLNRRCPCGTIQLIRLEYVELLESILRDAIDVRNGITIQEG